LAYIGSFVPGISGAAFLPPGAIANTTTPQAFPAAPGTTTQPAPVAPTAD
jgi:hypothetical protein